MTTAREADLHRRLSAQGAAAARHAGATRPLPGDAGAIPQVLLAVAAGVLLVALGYSLARLDNVLGGPLAWLGIGLVIVPVALRLLSRDATRAERIVLVVVLGLGTYLVKVLHGPAGFVLYDELLHLRTAEDLARTGGLLSANPLLPVSPAYPALELVTNAVASIAGVPLFEAGLVVVGIARVLLTAGLFALLEDTSGSARAAGIGVVVYAANPAFVFFDSQFAYESLALPLAIVVLWAGMRWQRTGSRAFAALAIAAVFGTVVTHHLTSFVLVLFLGLWAATTWFVDRVMWRAPAVLLAIAAGAAVGWMLLVAPGTVAYLEPRVASLFELVRLVLGQTEPRSLFQTGTGVQAAEWERIVAICSVLATLAVLPVGGRLVWRLRRRDPGAVAIALGALAWPASLALRLTAVGADEATRVPEFVFVGVALLGGLAIARLREPRVGPWPALARFAAGAGAAVLVVGGMILGMPSWNRLPGPYHPSADSRSIEPESLAAATWVDEHLPAGTRLVADRVNRALIGSVSDAYPVTSYGDGVHTFRLFLPGTSEAQAADIIRQGRIDTLVGDTRLTTSLPLTRVYFENGEPGMDDREAPLDPAPYRTWDVTPGVSRFYDSGAVRMWNVESIRDGR